MLRRLALAALLPFALAGCGNKGADNASAPAGSVKGVAAPAGTSWTDTVTRTAEGFRMGNPDAPVKVVEYGSRLCPACRALALEGYQPLIDNYVKPGKVSFEFREFLIHGAPDLPPALLGQCGGEATFFPVLEQMYQAQEGFNDRLTKLSPEIQQQLQRSSPSDTIRVLAEQMGLIEFMKQRGLPEAKARQCLADMSRIDALTKQTQDKGADGTVSGTPTVIVNGRKVEGATPNAAIGWSDLQGALKAAGA